MLGRNGKVHLHWLKNAASPFVKWSSVPSKQLFMCLKSLHGAHWQCLDDAALPSLWLLIWRVDREELETAQAAQALSLAVLDSQTKLRRVDALVNSIFAATRLQHDSEASSTRSLVDKNFQQEFAKKVEMLPAAQVEALWSAFLEEIKSQYLSHSSFGMAQARSFLRVTNLFSEVIASTTLNFHNSKAYASLLHLVVVSLYSLTLLSSPKFPA